MVILVLIIFGHGYASYIDAPVKVQKYSNDQSFGVRIEDKHSPIRLLTQAFN